MKYIINICWKENCEFYKKVCVLIFVGIKEKLLGCLDSCNWWEIEKYEMFKIILICKCILSWGIWVVVIMNEVVRVWYFIYDVFIVIRV